MVAVGVAVGTNVGVMVGVDVKVGVGVNVGPNACPDAQAEIARLVDSKITNKLLTDVARRFVLISSPASITGAPGGCL